MDWKRLREPLIAAAAISCVLSFFTILIFAKSIANAGQSRTAVLDLKREVNELRSLVLRLSTSANQSYESGVSIEKGNTSHQQPQPGEVDQALSLANEHLEKKEYDEAFDYLLVASRLSPSDARLFEMVMQFIEKVQESQDDRALSLAEDLLDRSDSLVHFQSPQSVLLARQRLADVRKKFAPQVEEKQPRSVFDPVRRLLDVW